MNTTPSSMELYRSFTSLHACDKSIIPIFAALFPLPRLCLSPSLDDELRLKLGVIVSRRIGHHFVVTFFPRDKLDLIRRARCDVL